MRIRSFLLCITAVLTLGAATALAACGSDDVGERITEQVTGGDVDIDSRDGNISFENEDGSFSAGSCEELPDGFPSEVPTPDVDPVGCSSYSDGSTRGFTLIYDTDDADVISSYRTTLADDGFEIEGTLTFGSGDDRFEGFTASNDSYTVIVGGGVAMGGGGISVSITQESSSG